MNNSPFKWSTSWSGIVLGDDNLLLPNKWTMTFSYNAVSDCLEHRDLAMQRMEFMIDQKFNTAIWVDFDNNWSELFYKKFNTYVITVPGDPFDSMIGAAALCKAASMTKDVFEFSHCSITSELGYSVENIIELDEALALSEYTADNHFFMTDGPWFIREDCGFTDVLCLDEEEVTLVKDSTPWSEHKMGWDQYDDDNVLNKTFVEKDERWIPMVIKGGKNGKGDNES